MFLSIPRGALLVALAVLTLVPQAADAQVGSITKKLKKKAQEMTGTADTSSAEPTGSGRKVFVNYDFIPGQRTLFYTDFTDEEVGNFPRRLEFKTGSMEVVELDGTRALKASDASGFVVPLPEVLPAKFTLEFDVINRNSMGVAAQSIKIYGGTQPRTDADEDRTRVTYGHLGWDVTGGGTSTRSNFTSEEAQAAMGHLVSVRVLGDGAYLKVYADGRRLANIPNANFLRGKGLFIAMEGRDGEANAVYITKIRIAESEKTVYDALVAAGRWATQGILFETGKATLQQESTPTLKQIAETLKQHAELRVRIEGHTDNVGSAQQNLQLSQARAAAVKDALVKEYGIDANRLETAGLGDTRPVADNGTAEGRSSNRRVEVVKL